MKLCERIDKNIVQTEVDDSVFTEYYDIIVAGLGTAGSMAAIAAAKKGLKVLGLEKLNCMGGQGTAGSVFSYYYGARGGLFEDIDSEADRLEEQGFAKVHGINPDLKKFVLEKEAIAAGVIISYESVVTGVYIEDKRIIGLRWFTAGKFHSAKAKVVIDSTADAEICVLAGCETHMGRETDGLCQPFSNVMVTRQDNLTWCRFIDEGYVNQTAGEELSKAIIESTTHPMHLREYFEPIDRVLYYTQHLGTREGRHIVGEENITIKDYFEDKLTDKPLLYTYSNLDKHGHDFAFESESIQEWSVVSGLWGINIAVPIPLGAIIPREYDGILAAARHLAVDHDMATAIRMKRDMQKLGEAAAIVAFAAIKNDCRLKDVSYDYILHMLQENKCLNEENNIKMKLIVSRDDSLNKQIDWITDKEEIKKVLSSDNPGFAIWSCRRLGKKIAAELKKWLTEKDENLSENSAIALGLTGDKAALNTLRQIIASCKSIIFEKDRNIKFHRGLASIYLLGKIGEANDVQDLKCIVEDFNIDNCCLTAIKYDYYLLYYINAFMALIKLGNKYPKKRKEIEEVIRKSFRNVDLNKKYADGKENGLNMIKKAKEFTDKLTAKW